MYAERPLTKWAIDHLHDSVRNGGDIRVGRHNGGKALAHLVGETRVRTCLVFSDSGLISGRPGVREMIGATGESAWNDNRSLNAPTRQFTRVNYGQRIHAGLRR